MPSTLEELAKLAAVGPVVGALIALTGVFATLIFQARDRRREREFTQRRDIYLQAAEALGQQIQMISSIGNTSLGPNEISRSVQGNPGWMNKVNMVASIETISAMNAANEFFATKLVDLIEQRIVLDDLTRGVDDLRRQLESIADFQHQATAALQALSQQPASPENQERFSWLLAELKRSKERTEELGKELTQRQQQQQLQHRKLIELSLRSSLEYQEQLASANLAMRREMRLRLNEAKFIEIYKGTSARLLQRFKEMLDKHDANQL
jgi:hypothetical protein